MEWFSQNWVWVLFFVGMIAMHMFGHGCHGSHDGHVNRRGDDDHGPKSASKDTTQRPSQQSSNHRH